MDNLFIIKKNHIKCINFNKVYSSLLLLISLKKILLYFFS